MSRNRDTLDWLFETGRIALERGPLLDTAPPPAAAGFDRARGAMLGLAVGDALGNTSESLSPAWRRAVVGEVRDYLPNPFAGGRRIGLPSDDSQLAFWTLERLIADGGLDPDGLAQTFATRPIFGIGQTVSGFLAALRSGRPWYACGPASAGNGALMRIAPLALPYPGSDGPGVWADTALAAMMTHNDRASTAACLAFVAMLREAMGMAAPPPPEWWLDTYVGHARGLEGESRYRPRIRSERGYEGPVWRFAETRVAAAHAAGRPAAEACEAWGSSPYLLETVPSVLYILMRHGDDPEEAIVRAVNDTRDNDTCGAIVGAAVGALHGTGALPGRWLTGLAGRTQAADDGRAFDLLDQAEAAFSRDACG